jgi:hypothetical protein
MKPRTLSIITGISYLIIFFAALFANFLVLEEIQKEPLATIQKKDLMVRLGIVAFIITVVFDIVVAWSLFELFKKNVLSGLSTLFRMTHAIIMGVAIFALPIALTATTLEEVLQQINQFNTIWLIGLFFFGIHLILLGKIINKPKVIAFFLVLAGVMYMVDTVAHFTLKNYTEYQSIFLVMVALPSIFGEMALAIWLLIKGGKEQ